MNWDRITTGNAMSGQVLVAAYMSNKYLSGKEHLPSHLSLMDRIVPAFIGIHIGFVS
jgi:hypothetical protein